MYGLFIKKNINFVSMNNRFKYKKRFLGVIACFSVAIFAYGQKIDSLVIKYVNMWSENTANISCCDFVELYKDANGSYRFY